MLCGSPPIRLPMFTRYGRRMEGASRLNVEVHTEASTRCRLWAEGNRSCRILPRATKCPGRQMENGWRSLPPVATSAIFLLPAVGGEPRRVSNPKAPGFDRAVSLSPDGRQLAYARCTGIYTCDVYVEDLSAAYVPRGNTRRITNQNLAITGLTWSRDGNAAIYSGSRDSGSLFYLWRAGIERQPPQRLEIAGPFASFPSVSPVGKRLVFSRNLQDYDIWRYHVGGATEPLILSSLTDEFPQLSAGRKQNCPLLLIALEKRRRFGWRKPTDRNRFR